MIEQAVNVRRATETDLGAILRIERDSFADPWGAHSFRASLANERMRFLIAEDSLAAAADDGAAVAGSAILGYIVALVLSEEAEIADLAVAPTARRRGIGGLLLDGIVSDAVASGVQALLLEVRESNVAARSLYASRYFRQVGTRRGYYRQPPENALLLRRDLDGI